MPKITKVLIESDEDCSSHKRVGRANWAQDYAGKTVLMIAILRGSRDFFLDLIREIQTATRWMSLLILSR